MMPTEKVKFTASVALPLGRFLERYQKEHNVLTRSEALEQAIKLLQECELEREYAESALENDPILGKCAAGRPGQCTRGLVGHHRPRAAESHPKITSGLALIEVGLNGSRVG